MIKGRYIYNHHPCWNCSPKAILIRYGYCLGWPCSCKNIPIQRGRESPHYCPARTGSKKKKKKNTTDISEYGDFSHVDDKAFADLLHESNDNDKDDCEDRKNYKIIPTLFKDYSWLHNLLVIKMTVSISHELFYNRLTLLINNQVLEMGVKQQPRPRPSCGWSHAGDHSIRDGC